jgi:ABC-type dipeptide/oligopeptide/nickel transport system ATPase component
MIAMALACKPKVLIADEPTTVVDATVQAQIFDLLKDIQARTNFKFSGGGLQSLDQNRSA